MLKLTKNKLNKDVNGFLSVYYYYFTLRVAHNNAACQFSQSATYLQYQCHSLVMSWITATSPSPDCHAASWTKCSLSLMPPHVSQSGRSVMTTSRCCSPDLHWLRIPQRNQYKLCVLVFNCMHGSAPRYLQEVIRPVANVEP